MNANLWLFQSVVAGDNWGSVAMPLIQEHPWTVLMFSLLTLVYAVLNCIVAVVVEVALLRYQFAAAVCPIGHFPLRAHFARNFLSISLISVISSTDPG